MYDNVSLFHQLAGTFVCVCRHTVQHDEIPDSQDRVPAGQGSEESEEPWHHKVDWRDSHWLLQGSWENSKGWFGKTKHVFRTFFLCLSPISVSYREANSLPLHCAPILEKNMFVKSFTTNCNFLVLQNKIIMDPSCLAVNINSVSACSVLVVAAQVQKSVYRLQACLNSSEQLYYKGNADHWSVIGFFSL